MREINSLPLHILMPQYDDDTLEMNIIAAIEQVKLDNSKDKVAGIHQSVVDVLKQVESVDVDSLPVSVQSEGWNHLVDTLKRAITILRSASGM